MSQRSKMRKVFVLDTSVLVYNCHSYKSFKQNDVVIPIIVLDELDHLKSRSNGVGRNARLAIRQLDDLSNRGEIHKGIDIENGITIKIDTTAYAPIGPDPKYGDNKILACAAKIKEINPKRHVVVVSKDINLRVRARAFGLLAEDYETDKIDTEDLYMGHRIIEDDRLGIDLFSQESLDINKHKKIKDLNPNECVLFVDEFGKGIVSGRRIGNDLCLIKDKYPWGLKLRNKEQLFAADIILDQTIPLVSLIGVSGSGKTLIALACALEMVLNKKQYDSLMIYKPIQPIGNQDVGYLPGDLSEKLAPWFSSIDDAFAFLFSDKSKKKDGWKAQLHQYLDNGTIQKEALAYVRGRSIPNSLILIDEVQNLSKNEVKTILTRVGTNSKVILTGDIEQIDNQYLDQSSNGLTHVIEQFKTSELSGHITFTKGERSALATIASEIL